MICLVLLTKAELSIINGQLFVQFIGLDIPAHHDRHIYVHVPAIG